MTIATPVAPRLAGSVLAGVAGLAGAVSVMAAGLVR